jgi:hypothetical protein
MSIGIVQDNEFQIELDRLSNSNKVKNKLGRNNAIETPQVIREIISAEVINGGNVNEVSKVFDISKSSISAYINGSTSTKTYHQRNKELVEHNNRVKLGITSKSRKIMMRAMDHISDDKLASSRATELALVAKSMSGIISDMEPQVSITNNTQNNVMVYKPRMREEDDYEIIQVNE